MCLQPWSQTVTWSQSQGHVQGPICMFVADTRAHRGQPLQGREALLPGGSGLLEGLVAFDELLHLIHTLTHLPAGEVGLLAQQPRLCHTRIPGELMHLQDYEGAKSGHRHKSQHEQQEDCDSLPFQEAQSASLKGRESPRSLHQCSLISATSNHLQPPLIYDLSSSPRSNPSHLDLVQHNT